MVSFGVGGCREFTNIGKSQNFRPLSPWPLEASAMYGLGACRQISYSILLYSIVLYTRLLLC